MALIGLLLTTVAAAAVLAEPDARAVHRVVGAPLEAIAADDAERAFSQASAGIRVRFGDADNYMVMVRRRDVASIGGLGTDLAGRFGASCSAPPPPPMGREAPFVLTPASRPPSATARSWRVSAMVAVENSEAHRRDRHQGPQESGDRHRTLSRTTLEHPARVHDAGRVERGLDGAHHLQGHR